MHRHNLWHAEAPDPNEPDIEHFEWNLAPGMHFARTSYRSSSPLSRDQANDPFGPCCKASLPYLKAQQIQTQMFKVDRKLGISRPSSVRLTFTAQNSHLEIRFLIINITMFTTIVTAHGFTVLDRRVVDRSSCNWPDKASERSYCTSKRPNHKKSL